MIELNDYNTKILVKIIFCHVTICLGQHLTSAVDLHHKEGAEARLTMLYYLYHTNSYDHPSLLDTQFFFENLHNRLNYEIW